MAGYSGTPLAKKLGIADSFKVLAIAAPADLDEWLQPLPEGARIGSRFRTTDVALVFATTVSQMERGVERAMSALPKDGASGSAGRRRRPGCRAISNHGTS